VPFWPHLLVRRVLSIGQRALPRPSRWTRARRTRS
jgi:hypothetical protein